MAKLRGLTYGSMPISKSAPEKMEARIPVSAKATSTPSPAPTSAETRL